MAFQRSFGRSLVLSCFFLGLALASCSDGQPAGDSKNPGKTFYQNRCAECHGMDGGAQLSGAADLQISTLNEDALKKIIRDGKNGMPPFKLLIDSDSLLQQTVEYVISLRKK